MLDEIGTADQRRPLDAGRGPGGRAPDGLRSPGLQDYDPRARALGVVAEQLVRKDQRLALARHVEETALRLLEEYKPGRRLYTNVEYYAAAVLGGVDLPPDLYPATFAVARTAGGCTCSSSWRTTASSARRSTMSAHRRIWGARPSFAPSFRAHGLERRTVAASTARGFGHRQAGPSTGPPSALRRLRLGALTPSAAESRAIRSSAASSRARQSPVELLAPLPQREGLLEASCARPRALARPARARRGPPRTKLLGSRWRPSGLDLLDPGAALPRASRSSTRGSGCERAGIANRPAVVVEDDRSSPARASPPGARARRRRGGRSSRSARAGHDAGARASRWPRRPGQRLAPGLSQRSGRRSAGRRPGRRASARRSRRRGWAQRRPAERSRSRFGQLASGPGPGGAPPRSASRPARRPRGRRAGCRARARRPRPPASRRPRWPGTRPRPRTAAGPRASRRRGSPRSPRPQVELKPT